MGWGKSGRRWRTKRMPAMARPLRLGEDPFYQPPPGFESRPAGTILRSREVELAVLGVLPVKVSAWQLLYRSCDLNLRPEATVTTVLLPAGSDPTQPRPLLAYQCAIDAVADTCFPSYALRRGARSFGCFPPLEMLVVANALRRDWAVSIADHEGCNGYFGAAREPGYRVLDGIRAAMAFEPAGLQPDAPVTVWGYSGGGMASSWVIEMAPEYAPEIALVGAVLGAPVGDPAATLVKLNGTRLAGLPAMVIAGIRHIYPRLGQLIRAHTTPAGLGLLDEVETLSTIAAILRFQRHTLDDYLDEPLTDLLATPARPRPRRLTRNSRQKSKDSLLPAAVPSTSRVPSAETPMATTSAWETTCAPTRTLQYVASRKTYGNVVWVRVRSRNAAISTSSCWQIRETSDLDIPDVTPSAATRSTTLRVETPCTQASMTTACRALSMRRRRSSSDEKNEPQRSFGIATSTSPLAVATVLGRVPLR